MKLAFRHIFESPFACKSPAFGWQTAEFSIDEVQAQLSTTVPSALICDGCTCDRIAPGHRPVL
jgi:hypothetical protein